MTRIMSFIYRHIFMQTICGTCVHAKKDFTNSNRRTRYWNIFDIEKNIPWKWNWYSLWVIGCSTGNFYKINFFWWQAFVFIFVNVHISMHIWYSLNIKQFINTVNVMSFEVSFQCCWKEGLSEINTLSESLLHFMIQGNTMQSTA
jgi:hypothetical protein